MQTISYRSSTIDNISPTILYSFVEAWEETQEVGGTSDQANLQAPQEDSVSSPASPSTQQTTNPVDC